MTRRKSIDFRGSMISAAEVDLAVAAALPGPIPAGVSPQAVSFRGTIQLATATPDPGASLAAATGPAPRGPTPGVAHEDDAQVLPGNCAILTLGSSQFVQIPSCAPYTAVRNAVTMGRFELVDGMTFPVALLDSPRGQAELRPAGGGPSVRPSPLELQACIERMTAYASALSDCDADVLDALFAIWIRCARSPADYAMATVDGILELRGLLRKKGGSGRRGGYEVEQRLAVQHSIERLASVWIDVPDAGLVMARGPRAGGHSTKTRVTQSRLLVITRRVVERADLDGSELPCEIDFQPGGVVAQYLFGAGHQVALLSVRALCYDPYRQYLEKRLIRYLSLQWRIRASKSSYLQPFRIETLLRATGETLNARRPTRTKARVERALGTLEDDGAIREWRYAPPWDQRVGVAGSLKQWPLATVIIEPPVEATTHYSRVRRPADPEHLRVPLGVRLRAERLRRELSPSQAAEQIGIRARDLEQLERGDPRPWLAHRDRKRVERWLGAVRGGNSGPG